MEDDPNFPTFHLRPRSNWINDPNGVIYFNSRYHIFMQYNPFGSTWGSIHWLHFSSPNFIEWKNHGIALSPDMPYDSKGCWSGCTVISDEGIPLIFYSADNGKKRVPSLVRGTHNFDNWLKHEKNPIIAEPPDVDLHGFRDHKVFQYRNFWYQLIGSGKGNKGILYCYRSNNLINWEYDGIFFELDHPDENMLECPDLVQIDNNWVLIYSTNNPKKEETCQSYYSIGIIEKQGNGLKFKSQRHLILDVDRMYAPQILQDSSRSILIGWIREDRGNEEMEKAGWSGAISIPRELKIEEISENNTTIKILTMKPISELKKLRHTKMGKNLIPKDKIEIPTTRKMELYLKYNSDSLSQNKKFHLKIEDKEVNRLRYEIIIWNNRVKVSSNLNKDVSKDIEFEIIEANDRIIHLFIDHSIVEIFIDNSICVSSRIYDYSNTSIIEINPKPSKIEIWELDNLMIMSG